MITKKHYLKAKEIVAEYELQIAAERAKKDFEKLATVEFGFIKKYKRGDVVVWKGNTPGICCIKKKCKLKDDSYYATKTHSSLHISNLRLATKKEIKLLGTKDFISYSKIDSISYDVKVKDKYESIENNINAYNKK